MLVEEFRGSLFAAGGSSARIKTRPKRKAQVESAQKKGQTGRLGETMDGLTVKGARQFLQSGSLDFKTLRSESGAEAVRQSSGSQKTEGASFAETLKKSISEVNKLQQVADQKIEELITGKTDNIAEVMIAKEQADVALRLMVQVRNKVLETYQEMMRMQV